MLQIPDGRVVQSLKQDDGKRGQKYGENQGYGATMGNAFQWSEGRMKINEEDLLCIELVEEIGQKMGRYLAGLINLLNPELVVIGGVLAETGDYILQPIKSAVRKYSLNLVNKDSAIVLSKLKERAGVIGACMLARKSMFES